LWRLGGSLKAGRPWGWLDANSVQTPRDLVARGPTGAPGIGWHPPEALCLRSRDGNPARFRRRYSRRIVRRRTIERRLTLGGFQQHEDAVVQTVCAADKRNGSPGHGLCSGILEALLEACKAVNAILEARRHLRNLARPPPHSGGPRSMRVHMSWVVPLALPSQPCYSQRRKAGKRSRSRFGAVPMSVDELKAEVLCLDPQTRAYLARELLASLDTLSEAEIEKLWMDEIGRAHV
jgi:hypothetical protein